MTFLERATPWVKEFGFSAIACDIAGKGPYGKNARDKAIAEATEQHRRETGNPKARLPLAMLRNLKRLHPLKGIYSKTNTLAGLKALAATVSPDANWGLCSDEKYTIFETDNREDLEKALGFKMPKTFATSARPNRGAWVFEQTAETREFWRATEGGILEVPALFEWRESGYVVGAGSIHPDTKGPYEIKCRVRPIPFPAELQAAAIRLRAEAPSSKGSGTGKLDQSEQERVAEALHKRGNPEDILTLPDDFVITSLHPLLKWLIGHIFDAENPDATVEIVQAVGEKYGHRPPGDNDVEDMVEWHIRHKSMTCFCEECHNAIEANLPPAFVWTSRSELQQTGPLWLFSKEADFALFKHRVEQTPAWAYAAEQKDPDGFWELPADYEAWRASQGNQEDPRLLTHATLKKLRSATPNPEIVEGVISENSANILVGDSGLGKTPLVVQLGVCVALGHDFLGQKTVQKKVMVVDYENAEALADVVGQICEHLKLPPDFEMDPKWFRIVQNVDASEVLKLVQEFKPDLVIVDSLRGFCPNADGKNEIASRLITELQSRKAAFLLMHHVRKNSTEKRDKRQPLEKEERVLDWLEAAAGSRALINQTFTRIAIDYAKADNADLVVRGFYKGRGEFGPWKLARNYSKQHGEPIGYDRLAGIDLLDIEQTAFFDVVPKGKPMTYKDIQHCLGQSEGQITRFLAACDNAQVVVATGKRKTRSRRYTFLAEKKAPKTAEELEQEESVREAFK